MTPRAVRAWVKAHVPEADTADKQATLAQGLELVGHLLQWPVGEVETRAQHVAALNRQSRAVAKAWDQLLQALRAHRTARVDLRQAGVDVAPLAAVVDQYRKPLKAPKSQRPMKWRNDILAQAVPQVRVALAIRSEARAAKIVAAFAHFCGVDVSSEVLRQTARNRRQ